MIVERDFPDHWKTQLLIRLLGNFEAAPVLILRLWAHCEARRTESFTELSPDALAAICRYNGNAKKLDKALQEARFIIRKGKAVTVHGWEERNRGLLASIENGKKGGRPRKNRQATDSEPTENPRVSDGKPTANPCRTSERRGEEVREIPPIVPQGGQSEEAGASKPAPPPCPDSPEKKEPGAVAIVEDAKRRICGFFGRKQIFLGYEAELALFELVKNGVLPLPEEDWQLLDWWLSLPKDERDSDLRNRRQHAETLACNLLAETDRAKGYAKKTGATVAEKKTPALDLAAFQEWHRERWPEVPVPTSFDGVPDYVLAEAKAAFGVA